MYKIDYISKEVPNKYSRYFSESTFKRKLKSVGFKVGEKLLYPVFLLYYMYKSDKVTIRDKAMIIGGLGYFILPTDVIADMLPLIGFTDDIAVLTIIIQKLTKNITDEIRDSARQHISWILNRKQHR